MAVEARTLRTETPRIRIGAPVAGSDYQPNERVDERLFDCLNRRQGALVLGPRRSGKSSLLRHTALRLTENHMRPALVDLQGMRTPFSLLAEIAPERRRDFMLDETEFLRLSNQDHIPFERLEKGVDEALRLLEIDVLMLDEVGMAVATERNELFSHAIALIAAGIERKGGACVMAAGADELRMALAKSEELRTAVFRFERITLRPWPKPVVRDFIRARLGTVDPHRLDEVVHAISPGWPMEVAVVARAAFQETPDDPVDVVVEREAIESSFILEHALAMTRHEEAGDLSPRILEALVSSESPLSLADLAKLLRMPPRRIVAPVDKLIELGIIASDPSDIDVDMRSLRLGVATPMMARRINLLFGTWRYPKR
jgi:hypothetical protein